jgi:hypothetical protein
MASTGTAPAAVPTRAVLGPVLTQAGFQYWYLACFPDCVIAVRQGIWAGLCLAMTGTVPPTHFGLLGVLLVSLMKGRGEKLRQQVEATLQSTPTSRLRMKPNLVYQTMQLRSITFKPGGFGTLITPDIILETKTGSKQKYGIQKPDFDKACAQLKQMYPDLCKAI